MTDHSAGKSEWLYLFTSNMRPLYEQDAVDVLAAAPGTHYRFRYLSAAGSDYLATGLGDRWRGNDLVGMTVLVLFSIQQQAAYHLSAYIPLRFGKVLDTRSEGSLHIVEFEVGDYVTVGLLSNTKGGTIKDFSNMLREHLDETPDSENKKSAVLGAPVALDTDVNAQHRIWERSAEYLAPTLSFRDHTFIRYSGLREVGTGRDIGLKEGTATLTAGRSYELRVTHFQPRAPSVIRYYRAVADGGIVTVVGDTDIPLSSRYDTLPIVFHATEREDERETLIGVSPADGVAGARVGIRARVRPDLPRRIAGAALTSISLFLVALPGLLPDTVSVSDKLLPTAVGLLLGGSLVAVRLKRT